MALKKLPYRKIRVLLTHYLSTEEDAKTATLSRELRQARVRGYLTRADLEKVCRWKSARAIRLIKNNSAARIRTATRRALATRSERRRIEALMTLDGVSVAMASAILTLLNPRRYGVIDIRVWQLLYALGEVTKKSSGVGFNFNNWYQFLMKLRYFAKQFGVGARDIERSLFFAHQANQKGTLYQRSRKRMNRRARSK
jgi:transposase